MKIGNGVRINSQIFIPEFTILEDEYWIGPNVVITNAKYPQSQNAKNELRGAHIKNKAVIGANSTLLPSIVIKENALIGAGSVVTKNVTSNLVLVGNPAKKVKKLNDIEAYCTK